MSTRLGEIHNMLLINDCVSDDLNVKIECSATHEQFGYVTLHHFHTDVTAKRDGKLKWQKAWCHDGFRNVNEIRQHLLERSLKSVQVDVLLSGVGRF